MRIDNSEQIKILSLYFKFAISAARLRLQHHAPLMRLHQYQESIYSTYTNFKSLLLLICRPVRCPNVKLSYSNLTRPLDLVLRDSRECQALAC